MFPFPLLFQTLFNPPPRRAPEPPKPVKDGDGVLSARGQAMTERVTYPLFEFVGPPCESPGCKGVLVASLDLKTKESFDCCSECGTEFHRMPAAEKLGYCCRTIERALKGSGLD